jgi:filamentous hemagglutinin
VSKGFTQGAGFSILATGEAVVALAQNPLQFIDGVQALVTSSAARSQLGEAVLGQVKADLALLEDAWYGRDWQAMGQQVGKLTADLAQAAGGVAGLAKLGITGARAGGRALLGASEDLAATRLIASTKNAAGTADQGATGIQWGKGIDGQGLPWEDYLAGKLPADVRLPPNFKTFDFYDVETKVATSAKTLDTTTSAKVANPDQVYYSLKSNVDAVANFEGIERLSGKIVNSGKITQRVVEVAILKGTTPLQWDQIAKAIQYGQDRGVIVKITVVKP